MVMGSDDKLEEVDVFDQIDEALEEREGADRRKQKQDAIDLDADRRKNDRRTTEKAS